MTIRLLWIFCCCVLAHYVPAQKNSDMSDLRNKLTEALDIAGARFGVAVKNLQTGETVFINENEDFHAASTMKTPVLAELFRQAQSGRFSLDDKLVIKNSFASIVDGSAFSLDPADDSETELYRRVGEEESIRRLAYEMITRSSNLATNLLIALVSPDSVMALLRSVGAKKMKVLRGVEDNNAFREGLNNTTTALDLLLLFEQLGNEKLVSPDASREMIRILLDQQFREIIPARLPADAKVAHKTGSITGVQHDSGIVFTGNGNKYVVVFLSRFLPADEKKVIAAMAGASRLIYDHFSR